MLEKDQSNFNKWSEGKIFPPVYLDLNPTSRCNLSCLHCTARGKEEFDADSELDADTYEKIVDQAADLGVKHITLCGGGEPTLAGDVVRSIMKTAKKKGIKGSLVTNGTLIDERLAKIIGESGWGKVQISFDGPRRKPQDKMRGKGTWDKVMKSINLLKKYGDDKTLQIELFPVIWSGNIDLVDHYIYLSWRLKLSHITFQPMRISEEYKELIPSEEQITSLIKRIPRLNRLAQAYKININLDSFSEKDIKDGSDLNKVISEDMKNNGSIACFQPWTRMTVKPNGLVGACAPSSDTFNLNVKEKSLKEIWNSKQFEDLRTSISRSTLPSFCSRCCGNIVIQNRELATVMQKAEKR